ncbi:MAG: peptidyl-prolyl cis-trans isomerase [Anaerolineaceae bacterium]
MAGIELSDRNVRFAILAFVAALALVVVGMLSYRLYDNSIGQPRSTILTVAGRSVSLRYYTDRLFKYAQDNQSSGQSLPLLEQSLLSKLEAEELIVLLASKNGLAISEEDITNQIAAELGVPVAGSGSSFDTLYRARLKTVKMSDENYRRLTKATIANNRLLDLYEKEVGTTAETVSVRAVVSNNKAAAEATLARIKAGEDMGTVAQKESTDLNSRQKDGIMDPLPVALLPEPISKALAAVKDGEIAGPVDANGTFWVLKVESRDPQGTLSTTNITQLAQIKLDNATKDLKNTTTVKRSLDFSDIKWAEKHIQ